MTVIQFYILKKAVIIKLCGEYYYYIFYSFLFFLGWWGDGWFKYKLYFNFLFAALEVFINIQSKY